MAEQNEHPRSRKNFRPHLPFIAVLSVVAIGGFRIAGYYWREGSIIIGAALIIAAVLRVVLSKEQMGFLAIRSRWVDVCTYAGLAAMILFLSATIAGGPLA